MGPGGGGRWEGIGRCGEERYALARERGREGEGVWAEGLAESEMHPHGKKRSAHGRVLLEVKRHRKSGRGMSCY